MEEDNQELESTKLTMKASYIVKRIMAYLRPYRRQFAVAVLLYVGNSLLSAIGPTILGKVVNAITAAVNGGQTGSMSGYSAIAVYGIVYAATVIFASVFYFFAGIAVQKMAQDIICDLRNDVFRHIQSLSIDQLHKNPVGKWVTRATNDINSIMTFFSDVLISIIDNSLFLFFVIGMLFYNQWRLAFVVVAFLPVIAALSFSFAYFSRKYYRIVRSNISRMNAFLSENLSGMETIQVFNQEKRKGDEFDGINNGLRKSNYNAVTVFAVFRPLIYLVYVASIICVFSVGLPMVAEGIMEIGTLYSFFLYTEYFFNPIQNLANQFNSFQSALAGAERVLIVLDTAPEITDAPSAKDIETLRGKIEFRHVWFAYKEDEWILKDVSFVIEPGQTVAFVGETGAGKSTIINLMVRNYDIQKGRILIDDTDIRNIAISSLRRKIGEMLQDVFLFSGTVKSNISLNDPKIADSEIIAACRYVGADSFIESLPHKYDEPVLENGNNFSQGQRQLISFARVVTYKPSVIVLDEATANIDTETEVIIQNSLEKIKSIGTMVMIAHRLSTIRHASMIYVVDHGRIVESGNHQSLLRQRGIYYNLYKIQSAERKLAGSQAAGR